MRAYNPGVYPRWFNTHTIGVWQGYFSSRPFQSPEPERDILENENTDYYENGGKDIGSGEGGPLAPGGPSLRTGGIFHFYNETSDTRNLFSNALVGGRPLQRWVGDIFNGRQLPAPRPDIPIAKNPERVPDRALTYLSGMRWRFPHPFQIETYQGQETFRWIGLWSMGVPRFNLALMDRNFGHFLNLMVRVYRDADSGCPIDQRRFLKFVKEYEPYSPLSFYINGINGEAESRADYYNFWNNTVPFVQEPGKDGDYTVLASHLGHTSTSTSYPALLEENVLLSASGSSTSRVWDNYYYFGGLEPQVNASGLNFSWDYNYANPLDEPNEYQGMRATPAGVLDGRNKFTLANPDTGAIRQNRSFLYNFNTVYRYSNIAFEPGTDPERNYEQNPQNSYIEGVRTQNEQNQNQVKRILHIGGPRPLKHGLLPATYNSNTWRLKPVAAGGQSTGTAILQERPGAGTGTQRQVWCVNATIETRASTGAVIQFPSTVTVSCGRFGNYAYCTSDAGDFYENDGQVFLNWDAPWTDYDKAFQASGFISQLRSLAPIHSVSCIYGKSGNLYFVRRIEAIATPGDPDGTDTENVVYVLSPHPIDPGGPPSATNKMSWENSLVTVYSGGGNTGNRIPGSGGSNVGIDIVDAEGDRWLFGNTFAIRFPNATFESVVSSLNGCGLYTNPSRCEAQYNPRYNHDYYVNRYGVFDTHTGIDLSQHQWFKTGGTSSNGGGNSNWFPSCFDFSNPSKITQTW